MARLVSDEAWATLTVWMEARGEPQEGRVAVAEVIRNRTQRKYQSDGTVASTCLRPLQFSSWNTLDPNRIRAAQIDDADAVVALCRAAWQTAEAGSQTVPAAVLYYNPEGVSHEPPWVAQCHLVKVIGRHHFYATGVR